AMPGTRVQIPPFTFTQTRAVSSNGIRARRFGRRGCGFKSCTALPIRGSDVTGNRRVFQTRIEGSTPFSRFARAQRPERSEGKSPAKRVCANLGAGNLHAHPLRA